MFEDLENYLKVSATPEFFETIQKSVELFDRFELQDWQIQYNNLLMTLDDQPIDEDLDKILELTRSILLEMMKNFEIVISDDANVRQINDILEFLALLEDLEETQSYIGILDECDDPTEAFCTLMANIKCDCPDNYYPIIHDVSVEFIARLRSVLSENAHFSDDAVIDLTYEKACIERLKSFMDYLKNNSLLIAKFIRDGAKPGLSFRIYFDQLAGYVNQQNPTVAAAELLAMAIVSKNHEDCRGTIATAIEKHYSDMSIATRLTIAINDLLIGWQNHTNSGLHTS